jgi:hypothetical protein
MEVVLGDWSGTVTFTGKDIAPTWTMKKGNVTKTGTFGVADVNP